MGTACRDDDPQIEPLVEIYQGDRVSAGQRGCAWPLLNMFC